MSGILVGLDGSGHSQRALEWAVHEAAIRHVPLTVLTVHEAVRGYYSEMAVYADDPVRTEDARAAAQAETDKVLAGLDGPHPESVTVKAVHGFIVEELINAAKDARSPGGVSARGPSLRKAEATFGKAETLAVCVSRLAEPGVPW
jgi:nucleotide-binding universal stress UspA family protein